VMLTAGLAADTMLASTRCPLHGLSRPWIASQSAEMAGWD